MGSAQALWFLGVGIVLTVAAIYLFGPEDLRNRLSGFNRTSDSGPPQALDEPPTQYQLYVGMLIFLALLMGCWILGKVSSLPWILLLMGSLLTALGVLSLLHTERVIQWSFKLFGNRVPRADALPYLRMRTRIGAMLALFGGLDNLFRFLRRLAEL